MTYDLNPVKLALEPSGKRGNLVEALTSALEQEILQGRLKPGDKLPTEAKLVDGTGVSRTVVREAVASLRAAGLVETRQGAGAFVLPASIRFDRFSMIGQTQILDILSVLELRLAVEVEAAVLAASRRNEADIARMDAALKDLDAARAAGSQGLDADLAFHQAVAAATQNSYFPPFLTSLGSAAVPRGRLPRDGNLIADLSGYLGLVLAEHQAIRYAIVAQDSALAGASMRAHLGGSRSRYARLLTQRDGAEDQS